MDQRIPSAPTAVGQPRTLEERYLDLIKRSLTRLLFPDESYEELPLDIPGWKGPPARLLSTVLRSRNLDLVRKADPSGRYLGRDWPQHGETMIGMARLNNLQECVEQVVQEGIPGDLIETGVWRGGAAILMRAVLAARGDTERTVWLADSFQGLPKPNTDMYPADAGLDLWKSSVFVVGVEEVKKNFEKYALLDDQVKFLVGWFRDTLPSAPISQLAVLRLDGDLYESTMDALSVLYPKLSIGGYLIVDDFYIPACAKAIEDYRTANSITELIQDIDGHGAFWRRERGATQ
jgi:O-methyltransferase